MGTTITIILTATIMEDMGSITTATTNDAGYYPGDSPFFVGLPLPVPIPVPPF
jgi:hypothetical protein